ncbi:MAG: SecY-interacting protein Syd, partial [Pseudomonadales bacterium]|nr:SecY-interacting protein Syd [Pseudomonadales bacterium]
PVAETPEFYAVDNQSGEVLLENPATNDRRVLAADLASFISTLRPSLAPPGLY